MSDSRFGGSDFGIRFFCGAIFGGVLGFGVWVGACGPTYMAGRFNAAAWLVGKLGVQDVIHSGWAALLVIAFCATVVGLIVGIWHFERGA